LRTSAPLTQRPPRPPLFPYTTLFRSRPYAVLAAARDSGELMLSVPVNFTEDDAPAQPGFLLIAPVYRAGSTVTTTAARRAALQGDRKSTRLNSSHVKISYAVFCLKQK